jgi:hypothetical protein
MKKDYILYKPDELWKAIIEDLFDSFILFFFPDLYKITDFEKGYEFLERELKAIISKSKGTKSIPDKLVKIFLKDGSEKWILIHIEIQGYWDKKFPLRMFRYYYRIFDKYDKDIISIAIFTDEYKNYSPDSYQYKFFGTELIFKYNHYKVISQREKILLKSENPFALIILSGLYAIKSKDKINERYQFKIKLIKLLLERKYSRDKIEKIFGFIDGIINLSEEDEIKFKDELETIEGTTPMGITKEMTNIYQVGRLRGVSEGKMEGKMEGKIEGKMEGKIEGKIEGKMEGKIEGKMEGKIEGKMETARQMLKHGISKAVILKCTGLNKKDLEKIEH